MVSGKIMAPHGNLFPGHVAQVKFIARKGYPARAVKPDDRTV